jgi:hypothetical protein
MSDDRLLDAVCALRESADTSPARPDLTRARVIASLRKRRSYRHLIVKVTLPLAAVLVGSTAWAAATGRLPADWPGIAALLGMEAPAVASAGEAPTSQQTASIQGSGAGSDNAGSPAEKPAEPPRGVAPHPTPGATTARQRAPKEPKRGPAAEPPSGTNAPARAEPTEPQKPASADPDGDALYAAAHRLHFGERNPGAALGAWDAYLRAAPRGRFSVEAHYNRALCLVRLGRSAEARRALEPFARGGAGGYRQTEARGLLDAMGSAAP